MAKLLSNYFSNVLIYNILSQPNSIYNKSFKHIEISTDLNEEYNIENTLVIYGEGVEHNPLNSKYIVRWILGQVGINCRKDIYLTWGKNDLVYHFNNDHNMNNKLIHKLLSYVHINPKLTNNNNVNRSGACYAIRKGNKFHTNLIHIHPEDSFCIHNLTSQTDLIDIFNSKVCFISYDPLTFLNIMAAMCGCISVVYKSGLLTKEEWYKTTVIYRYLKETNEPLYGIAYGSEEIDFAISTIHLVKEQWSNFQKYLIENSIVPFVKEMENIDILENTVFNNYINK
jgi:hypothetical protein